MIVAYAVATILATERLTGAGRQIAAFVIDARGQIQGYQPRTNSTRPKISSMCPEIPGDSSRSKGLSLEW